MSKKVLRLIPTIEKKNGMEIHFLCSEIVHHSELNTSLISEFELRKQTQGGTDISIWIEGRRRLNEISRSVREWQTDRMILND